MMTARRLLVSLALIALASGGGILAHHGYIRAKGLLARHLIDSALEAHLRDGGPHRPWSWADILPIARLEIDRLGVSASVLSGASGASLAFGVGHVDGTARPGLPGNCVLAGHRDRAFAFLRHLEPGDVIRLRTHAGARRYVVDSAQVVRATATGVLRPTPGTRLTLVTCYPFDGLVGSPWRYVVGASAIEEPEDAAGPRGI
jgi:sortase A